MKKNYLAFALCTLLTTVFISCSDDDDYVPIANPPVAVDDVVNSTLTSPVVIPVLANDLGGGIPLASTVSITGGVDTDANGSLDQLVVLNQGSWSVNVATGEITFTPTPTFTGNPTPITYTVANENGEVSNAANVTINATPIVSGDLSLVPFTNLSEYHFFIGDIKNLTPSMNVIPYEPASGLFTDYAQKKRFIWMPAGVQATFDADNKTLIFPVGTILIKNFYYTTIQPGNVTKIIETRLLVRRTDRWYFYEYVWNDAQTDAVLTSGSDFENGDTKYFQFTKPNGTVVNEEYRIPSESECHACHKINEIRTPIGIKPQNINWALSYNGTSVNQLQKLVDQGYLQSYPANINSTVDYHDTTKTLDQRFRSYVDANCAHCHQDLGRCDYRALRFNFGETLDLANMGVCVQADEVISPTLQKLITPGNYNKSIVHYRLSINDESERMPLLGRTITHDEGLQLVEDYISSLTQTCN